VVLVAGKAAVGWDGVSGMNEGLFGKVIVTFSIE